MDHAPTEDDYQRWTAMDIWQQADELTSGTGIVIDRPAGSSHPKISSIVYPVDYGYLAETTGGDGEGIDVWVGPGGSRTVAAAWTLDLGKRNTEAKLLLGCGEHELALIEQFYDTQPQAAIVLRRPT
ncbi:MAG: Inorganic pyrophosphatase [Acidimicrobiales bacterium]|nr:Inorganic pyrophosphatase [Acidimicrobiales bacterium]